MYTKKNIVLITIIALVLGIFVVRQFFLNKKIHEISQPKVGEALAYEVAELIKNNTESREQIVKLQEQVNKLRKSSSDLKTAKETLDEKSNIYKIILGFSSVKGTGVIISFDKKIHSTQLVDLMNALKNIGVEAVSLNGQRITPTSSIDYGTFNPPVIIKAIGDKDLLESSLIRAGGIISQIGIGEVEKNDVVVIK